MANTAKISCTARTTLASAKLPIVGKSLACKWLLLLRELDFFFFELLEAALPSDLLDFFSDFVVALAADFCDELLVAFAGIVDVFAVETVVLLTLVFAPSAFVFAPFATGAALFSCFFDFVCLLVAVDDGAFKFVPLLSAVLAAVESVTETADFCAVLSDEVNATGVVVAVLFMIELDAGAAEDEAFKFFIKGTDCFCCFFCCC
mmetsp:Transcript_16049/g.25023  ORF Transcript_16049/g.25023 Transcript_16049/m.25023 type:complete len:204 (+) Transcript_16049:627-1238(+)